MAQKLNAFFIVLLYLFTLKSLTRANPLEVVKSQKFNRASNTSVEVCNTDKCKDYAKFIQESISPNYTAIDPCVDFDAYACDGWRNGHTWRADQSSVSVTVVLIEEIQGLLRSILESPYAENTTFKGLDRDLDKKNFAKLKTTYDACMNEDKQKAVGIAPMRKMLDEFEKLYPLVHDPNSKLSEKEELTQVLAWLLGKNIGVFMGVSPTADETNPDVQVIAMGGAEVSEAKQYYLKKPVMANYTRMAAEMFQVLSTGKNIDEEPIPAAKNESLYAKAKKVVDFETLIASKIADPEMLYNVKYSYKPRSITQVEKMVPAISALDLLKSRIPDGFKVTSNTTVIVNDINYYNALNDIITKASRDTLHDYLQWRLFLTWTPRLSRSLSTPLRRFNNIMAGKEPDAVQERHRTCIRDVDDGLGHLLSSVFIQRKFTPRDKEIGDQVIMDIRKIFKDNMKNLDWMSTGAKEIAAQKVANVNQKIGYQTKGPNEASPKDINNYYQNLTVSDSFWNNGFDVLKFNADILWRELLKPTDRNKWEMTAPAVNAYYSPQLNEIVFPAGIMQPPMFSGDLPDYISYGSFGSVAGHELTHGFDDNGSKYDASGRLRDWWDNSTVAHFDNKTQCFVKQYAEYFIVQPDGEKLHLNGKLTLGENIADAGGLNAAFKAWKAREIATGKPDPAIAGLEKFTNEQLFFISYANSWCEKTRANSLMTQVFSDSHSPARSRIIGTTANSDDFRKAFNCPVKKETCDLWF